MLRTASIAALALAVLAPALASGSGPDVAVVEFRTEGEIAPAVREKLALGLHKGLAAALTVMPLDDSQRALRAANAALIGCHEAACIKEMSRTLGWRVLVQASARSEMEFYHLGLKAVDANTGRLLLTSTAACEICTLQEAAAKLQTTAERFSADLGPLASGLPSDSPAAAVVVPPVVTPPPTTPPPTTPPTRTPPPSASGGEPPNVLAPKPVPPGVFPEAPPAPGAGGTRKPPTASGLPPVPGPDPTPPGPATPPPSTGPDDFPYGIAAFGALAGGLVLLGTGGVLIAKDGDSTCDNKPLQQCPTVYDTDQAGLVTVVLGGAGLLTSVVLFLMQQAATGMGPETPPQLPRLPGRPKSPAPATPSTAASWQITW